MRVAGEVAEAGEVEAGAGGHLQHAAPRLIAQQLDLGRIKEPPRSLLGAGGGSSLPGQVVVRAVGVGVQRQHPRVDDDRRQLGAAALAERPPLRRQLAAPAAARPTPQPQPQPQHQQRQQPRRRRHRGRPGPAAGCPGGGGGRGGDGGDFRKGVKRQGGSETRRGRETKGRVCKGGGGGGAGRGCGEGASSKMPEGLRSKRAGGQRGTDAKGRGQRGRVCTGTAM